MIEKYNKEKQKSSFAALLLITVIFFTSLLIALILDIPISRITTNFNYNVIIILITMELFTNLIIETNNYMKELADEYEWIKYVDLENAFCKILVNN